jgi:hypothetical protein
MSCIVYKFEPTRGLEASLLAAMALVHAVLGVQDFLQG